MEKRIRDQIKESLSKKSEVYLISNSGLKARIIVTQSKYENVKVSIYHLIRDTNVPALLRSYENDRLTECYKILDRADSSWEILENPTSEDVDRFKHFV